MSQRKLPWSGPEKKLLLEIWSEKPHGQLSEITRDFNARNDQVQPKTITDENNRYRTEEAIKMQLKGMRKESKQSSK
jgi:hypothetical protein